MKEENLALLRIVNTSFFITVNFKCTVDYILHLFEKLMGCLRLGREKNFFIRYAHDFKAERLQDEVGVVTTALLITM